MVVCRYPPPTLAADHARALAGLALTGAPFLLPGLSAWVAVPLAGASALFLMFAARTLRRQFTTYVLDDNGLTARGPLGRRVEWRELSRLRLRFYPTRRDRRDDGQDGWMVLTLTTPTASLSVDSTLEPFDPVVERALEAARRHGLALDPTTIDNLYALGFDPG